MNEFSHKDLPRFQDEEELKEPPQFEAPEPRENLHHSSSFYGERTQATAAGLPCSGGTNSSFFQAQEIREENTIEAIVRKFNEAKTLIDQKRTYCKIKGILTISDAFFRNEERVNFILQNHKDPFEVIYQLIKPNLKYILNASYQLDPEQFDGLKVMLQRIEQYLDE